MRSISLLSLFLFLICTEPSFAEYQYLSPRPGAKMINPEHNVIIREGSTIDPASLESKLFSIRDSKGNSYKFNLILARDGKTITLNPERAFGYNEEITVSIGEGLRAMNGKIITGTSFSFFTDREFTEAERKSFHDMAVIHRQRGVEVTNELPPDQADVRDITGMFEITVTSNPTKGDIFFNAVSSYGTVNDYVGYHIITHEGDSIYSKNMTFAGDFELTESGYLSIFNGEFQRYDILDSNYTIIDKWYPTNGYILDNHEFLRMDDGTVLFISLEFQIVDMTVYDPDYSPNAVVEGTVIQEFDADHNLVFEWRSFDHVDIPEAIHQNLAFSQIDYVHTNSLEIDVDGHIIASHRHLDQVTKIDRNTGEFIWRFGGLNNEFTFIGDPLKFNFQHDARRLPNGNLMLYDNGNFHLPAKSFVKEYLMNETSKTATLVWSYSHPDVSGNTAHYYAMGSAQRLSNGNTFINWGARGNFLAFLPSMTEINSSGQILWELRLTNEDNMLSYRARKHEWDPCARPTSKKMDAKEITSTSARLKWNEVASADQYILQYRVFNTTLWNTINVDASKHSKKITGLTPSTKYEWRLATQCTIDTPVTSGHTSIKKFTTLDQKSLLDEENETLKILIYPNPADNYLTLRIAGFISESSFQKEGEIHVLDLLGQTKIKSLFTGKTETTLDLTALSPGTYLVQITIDDQRWIENFVIQ